MKLSESAKQDVDQDKYDENVLTSVDSVSVHCSLVKNNHQKASKVLFTFEPDQQFCQLITIAPHSLAMLKNFNWEFQSIKVCFTEENNRPIEIEDNGNITLIMGTG